MQPSIAASFTPYHVHMQHSDNLPPEFEQYLALCQRVYERMEREGSWPWKTGWDSTLPDHLVESESTHDIV